MPQAPIDTAAFDRNRAAFPDERLEPYRGKYVSWNRDGTQIVACGDTWADLYERMKALGIDPADTVDEFIPAGETSYLPMGYVS